MSRLTEKNGYYKEYIGDSQITIGVKVWNNALTQKLGQLEDIEEELGIDLITLFKAYNNGFYRYSKNAVNNNIYFIAKPKLNMKELCFSYGSYGKSYFKDYGKTWSLDKNELIKEN